MKKEIIFLVSYFLVLFLAIFGFFRVNGLNNKIEKHLEKIQDLEEENYGLRFMGTEIEKELDNCLARENE